MATDDFEEAEDFDAEEDDEDLELDELDELEDLDADIVDDDDEDPKVVDDDEEEEDVVDDEGDDDDVEEEEEEESLDALLVREQGLDEDDLIRLDDEPRDGLTTRADPVSVGEFTCRSCFLVKRRAQLADEKRMICFDCA